MGELIAAEADRRHLEADLVVKDEYVAYLRSRLAELEGDVAYRRARLAEHEGVIGDLSERLTAALQLAAGLQTGVTALTTEPPCCTGMHGAGTERAGSPTASRSTSG